MFFFLMAQQPLVGQGLHIIEASRSHSDTPQSVGLLWTSDRPVAETSTWKHSHEADVRTPSGIRNRNLSRRRPQTNALERAATAKAIPLQAWTRP